MWRNPTSLTPVRTSNYGKFCLCFLSCCLRKKNTVTSFEDIIICLFLKHTKPHTSDHQIIHRVVMTELKDKLLDAGWCRVNLGYKDSNILSILLNYIRNEMQLTVLHMLLRLICSVLDCHQVMISGESNGFTFPNTSRLQKVTNSMQTQFHCT